MKPCETQEGNEADDELDFDKAWEQLEWTQSTKKSSTINKENRISPRKKTPSSSPKKKKSPRKKTTPIRDEWQDDWREPSGKENRLSSSGTQKSMGISPNKFHRKRHSTPKHEKEATELKKTIETNLLSREKQEHKEELENHRKEFRLITSLKTWPVQGMAMEHLDHLQEGRLSLSQFHGGDYLSSESASSSGSATETNKRRLDIGSPMSSSKPTDVQLELAREKFHASDEPLWSLEPRIFATEKAQGKRKYLVGHFGRVADWYWRKCVNKHLYEVIREKTPCRMYFDLEYSKRYNCDVEEEKLLSEFREELDAEMRTYFGIGIEPKDIIDLDSSSDVKFSRHWIIDVDTHGLFEDTPAVGRFIKRLVGRLAEELATEQLQTRRPTLAKHLFVQTKDPEKPTCFIDLGVYTRNRLFRCFASSKFGKTNTLQLAHTNAYPMELLPSSTPKTGESQQDSAEDSVDQLPSPKQSQTLGDYIVANDWRPHARALATTLVVPLGGHEGKKILTVPQDEGTGVAPQGGSRKTKAYPAAVSIRTTKTPLPKLDEYIMDVLACRGGVQGEIRAWSMEYGGPREDIPVSITYQLFRNRYCELVGRAHKSNNIYWTIIFDNWTCIQGCHDPDCFGRGSPVPIQEDLLHTIRDEYEAWQDDEFEKALLTLKLDDLLSKTKSNDVQLATGTQGTKAVVVDTSGLTKKVEGSSNTSGTATSQVDNGLEAFSLSDEALLAAIDADPSLYP